MAVSVASVRCTGVYHTMVPSIRLLFSTYELLTLCQQSPAHRSSLLIDLLSTCVLPYINLRRNSAESSGQAVVRITSSGAEVTRCSLEPAGTATCFLSSRACYSVNLLIHLEVQPHVPLPLLDSQATSCCKRMHILFSNALVDETNLDSWHR